MREQILYGEKLAHEIENLKLEMDVKRAKLKSLEKKGNVMKLPQVSVPSFLGKITEWFTFWDYIE